MDAGVWSGVVQGRSGVARRLLFVVCKTVCRALQEIRNRWIRIIGDMPHLTACKCFRTLICCACGFVMYKSQGCCFLSFCIGMWSLCSLVSPTSPLSRPERSSRGRGNNFLPSSTTIAVQVFVKTLSGKTITLDLGNNL